MTFHGRTVVVNSLEKYGRVSIGKIHANVINGLILFTGEEKDVQKELALPNGNVLENPMTWDTFTHIYLFYK